MFGLPEGQTNPALILYNRQGRQAMLARMNELGEATLYFQSKETDGEVAVGYLWASDSLKPGEKDPLGSWGIRLREPGLYKSFDTFDPAKVHPSPEKVPADPSLYRSH